MYAVSLWQHVPELYLRLQTDRPTTPIHLPHLESVCCHTWLHPHLDIHQRHLLCLTAHSSTLPKLRTLAAKLLPGINTLPCWFTHLFEIHSLPTQPNCIGTSTSFAYRSAATSHVLLPTNWPCLKYPCAWDAALHQSPAGCNHYPAAWTWFAIWNVNASSNCQLIVLLICFARKWFHCD